MNREEKLALKFLNQFGYEKFKGFLVHKNVLPDDYDECYWSKEDLDDLLTPCTFYAHRTEEMDVFEDIWQTVDYVEDIHDVNFDDWKKSQKVSK